MIFRSVSSSTLTIGLLNSLLRVFGFTVSFSDLSPNAANASAAFFLKVESFIVQDDERPEVRQAEASPIRISNFPSPKWRHSPARQACLPSSVFSVRQVFMSS